MLFPIPVGAATFFPAEWSGPSGHPSVGFLLVAGMLLAYAGACFVGAIASAQSLAKWGWLTGTEKPFVSRIACIAGTLVFTAMASLIILGWFRIL